GGTVDIFVEPIVWGHGYVDALERAAAAEAGCVTTAIDWSAGPRKAFSAIGAGAGPAAAISPDGREVIEQFAPAPRVIVFGAGHVGAAIVRAAAAAGFRAVVVDDRAEFAAAGRFPTDVIVAVATAEDAIARFTPGAGDAVVIATRGHREDARILDRLAASPAGYVGLLGSRRKRAVLTAALTAAGVPPGALARVRVPVGLAIGAVTPEEIAVSVVAELIAWRRDPTGSRA
ncbi:MAG TPA: XdhC family protein, partial [Gemmatimonadales bacterium]|nr:XdhC family protein [Gemmatimonadales bacterium]